MKRNLVDRIERLERLMADAKAQAAEQARRLEGVTVTCACGACLVPDVRGRMWCEACTVAFRLSADAADSGECEACGAPYVKRDPRQRFCSDRCQNRLSHRRYRAKKRTVRA